MIFLCLRTPSSFHFKFVRIRNRYSPCATFPRFFPTVLVPIRPQFHVSLSLRLFLVGSTENSSTWHNHQAIPFRPAFFPEKSRSLCLKPRRYLLKLTAYRRFFFLLVQPCGFPFLRNATSPPLALGRLLHVPFRRTHREELLVVPSSTTMAWMDSGSCFSCLRCPVLDILGLSSRAGPLAQRRIRLQAPSSFLRIVSPICSP